MAMTSPKVEFSPSDRFCLEVWRVSNTRATQQDVTKRRLRSGCAVAYWRGHRKIYATRYRRWVAQGFLAGIGSTRIAMRFSVAVVVLVLGLSMAGCFEGPQGPQGPPGPPGPAGPAGASAGLTGPPGPPPVYVVLTVRAAASAQRARRVRPGHTHSSSPRAIPSANSSVAPARSLSPSPVLAARSKSRQLPNSNSASCISASGPALALCLRQ